MTRRRNIVLTGFMGSGKSYTGRALAKVTGLRFYDTDAMIESDAGMTVSEIFERLGEVHFRALERDIIKRLSEQDGTIISVGGGAIVNPDNLAELKRNGIVICLSASPETILSRVGRNSDRPLLQVDDKIGKIRELLDKRAPYYAKADLKIETDGKSPEQVAEEIVSMYHQEVSRQK